MKTLLATLSLLLGTMTILSAQSATETSPFVHIPTYTDGDLISRINSVKNSVVPPRFDRTVKSYINTYTLKKREKTERMLGYMNVYFPLFDQYTTEKSMPQDLKYLPIVESALNPHAVSRSGAVGLWQFMPATARDQGLKINSLVDERKDPNKSTEAALRYLGWLYKRYGDWSLTLAAYNGGLGRVNRAIRRGRSKNFWRIRKYLPAETRAYVPAFIAASYIVQYYHEHNLLPLQPEVELQNAVSRKIYERISFQMIEEVTGTPQHIIELLNPSYKQRFIPSSSRGNFLSLPRHRMAAMLNYLGRPDERLNQMVSQQIFGPENVALSDNFVRVTYIVHGGESLQTLADKYNCQPADIKRWNRLHNDHISRGQQLQIYQPKLSAADMLPVSIPTIEWRAKPLKNKSFHLSVAEQPSEVKKSKTLELYKPFQSDEKEDYLYHQVRRRESLLEIADQYPGISFRDLIRINNIKRGQQIKPGMKIRIKKL